MLGGDVWYNPPMPQTQEKHHKVSAINRSFEERDAKERAQTLGVPYIDIGAFPFNPDTLSLITREDAQAGQMIPFEKNNRLVRIAAVNPESPDAKRVLESLKAERLEPEVFLCSSNGLEEVMRWYDDLYLNRRRLEMNEDFEEDHLTFEEQKQDFSQLEKKIIELPAEKALNEIEVAGLQARASDIHLQPEEHNYVLRFRVDGMLHDIVHIDHETARKLVTLIKYESGMKSNVYDIPQDGHMAFVANGRTVDLRVSTLPSDGGESVVIRILDSEKGIRPLGDLGFRPQTQKTIEQVLRIANGMILVTGPTGSGKTTTLYSMLTELNTPERKLVSLEDPVEYHLDNVTQVEVDEKNELNFHTGLRALLRHDPDIVLIGEIRDFDTAKLAVEASLTGHILLSSLHTNSAIGAITRLRNLGLENYNISSSVNAIFAQRLVRKVCPHCAKQKSFAPEGSERLVTALEHLRSVYPQTEIPTTVPEAVGCKACSHTGYLGRTAVCEMVIFTNELRDMVGKNAPELEMEKYLKETAGFTTLFEEGIRLVLEGTTTLEEVGRVTG